MNARPSLRAAALLAFAAPLLAQQLPPLSISEGAGLGERRGHALADAGDLDGDGLSETWVGSPFESTTSLHAGAVRALSGASGLAIRTLHGDAAVDHFGWSLAALPDVDGDGVPDLAVGSPTSDFQVPDGGAVRVFSGRTGGVLTTIPGLVGGGQFGYSLCFAGDVDGDGFPDLACGAPFDSSAGIAAGSFEVRSAASGALILRRLGAAGDRLGISVAAAGDVDLDARADVLAGADQDSVGSGCVRLYSGSSGTVLHTWTGASPLERFGCAVAGARDVDGDGVPDVAVGANAARILGLPTGAVRVFSGTSGQLLWELAGLGAGEAFGSAVLLFPDIDGDARAEILASGWFEGGASGAPGVVRLHSSRTGRPTHAWRGRSGGDRFGLAIAAASDRDGDARADLLSGAPKDDTPVVDGGAAFVLSTRSAAPEVHCVAKPNSLGCLPSIGATGFASASNQSCLELSVAQVIDQKSGIYFFGTARASIPFQGGTLCVAPPIQRSPAVHSGGVPGPPTCTGNLRFRVDAAWIQARGWSAGSRVQTQAWYRDPSHPDGTASGLSDALEFTVWL